MKLKILQEDLMNFHPPSLLDTSYGSSSEVEALLIVHFDASNFRPSSSPTVTLETKTTDGNMIPLAHDSIGEDFNNSVYLTNGSYNYNDNSYVELPIDMQFNDGHLVSVVVYTCLFIFSAIGNSSVLAAILRRRRHHSLFSRIDFMLMHLAIADLMVTFLMMPLEVAWAITVSWRGGDFLCRIMAFFRIFGLFLSSFVLVCLAIDRYLAVKYPMRVMASVRRGKIMIGIAWILSVICSVPQVKIFHVQSHPQFPWYTQCVTFNAFPTPQHEIAYLVFGMLMTYAFPLVIIALLYCGIVRELYKRTRESAMSGDQPDGLRRSGLGNLGKAKEKTLKMTVVMVVIFFVCWTPYYVMCLWYWIDKPSAQGVDRRIQKALFLFACTNSTVANPIVYGIFHMKSAFRAPQETRGGRYSRESVYRTINTANSSNSNAGRHWNDNNTHNAQQLGHPMTLLVNHNGSNNHTSIHRNNSSRSLLDITAPLIPQSANSSNPTVLHSSVVCVHPLHKINSCSAGSLKYPQTKLSSASNINGNSTITQESSFC